MAEAKFTMFSDQPYLLYKGWSQVVFNFSQDQKSSQQMQTAFCQQ